MDVIRRLAAIGTRGFGRYHRSLQDEPELVNDEGLKLDMLIGRKQMRTEII
jgi:hypothetical protein